MIFPNLFVLFIHYLNLIISIKVDYTGQRNVVDENSASYVNPNRFTDWNYRSILSLRKNVNNIQRSLMNSIKLKVYIRSGKMFFSVNTDYINQPKIGKSTMVNSSKKFYDYKNELNVSKDTRLNGKKNACSEHPFKKSKVVCSSTINKKICSYTDDQKLSFLLNFILFLNYGTGANEKTLTKCYGNMKFKYENTMEFLKKIHNLVREQIKELHKEEVFAIFEKELSNSVYEQTIKLLQEIEFVIFNTESILIDEKAKFLYKEENKRKFEEKLRKLIVEELKTNYEGNEYKKIMLNYIVEHSLVEKKNLKTEIEQLKTIMVDFMNGNLHDCECIKNCKILNKKLILAFYLYYLEKNVNTNPDKNVGYNLDFIKKMSNKLDNSEMCDKEIEDLFDSELSEKNFTEMLDFALLNFSKFNKFFFYEYLQSNNCIKKEDKELAILYKEFINSDMQISIEVFKEFDELIQFFDTILDLKIHNACCSSISNRS